MSELLIHVCLTMKYPGALHWVQVLRSMRYVSVTESELRLTTHSYKYLYQIKHITLYNNGV